MIPEIKNRDPLTDKIIGVCFQVHNKLGPGFNEKIYSNALKIIFDNLGIHYETEKEFSITFQDKKIGKFRADLVIENSLIIELKSVEGKMPKIFEKQVISYLNSSKMKVGLLVNFGNYRCEIRRLMLSPRSEVY
ncbi:MAG: GxxExxY protein [Elusimicrobia bacterium]|nr:GxxExxY protein [Elusimicrobiota bacterium]